MNRVAQFFHGMENFFAGFPRHGKISPLFSTAWKNFSGFFHAMENLPCRPAARTD